MQRLNRFPAFIFRDFGRWYLIYSRSELSAATISSHCDSVGIGYPCFSRESVHCLNKRWSQGIYTQKFSNRYRWYGFRKSHNEVHFILLPHGFELLLYDFFYCWPESLHTGWRERFLNQFSQSTMARIILPHHIWQGLRYRIVCSWVSCDTNCSAVN